MINGGVPDGFVDLAEMISRAEANAELSLAQQADPEVVASTRRRRKQRRVGAAVVALVFVAAIGTYVPVTLLAPTAEATVVMDDIVISSPAAVALELPQIGASAISVMGADDFAGTAGTDGILASSGGPDARPIASITKLVSALVILDTKPLGEDDAGPTLRFSKADAALYDKYYVMNASIQSMKAGSTMSQRDALEMMLVASATNYAEAVSTWAFGSQANFRRAAQSWLTARGLGGTTIVEPTGIDPRNLSTPADLIAIGKLALEHPVVAEIVRSPMLDVPGIAPVQNTNNLVGVDGISGIKTGTLDLAGACLLFSAVLDVKTASPVTVIGVVLGGENKYSVDAAVRKLLASVTAGFHEVPLLTEGQVLGTYSTPWEDDALIVAGEAASVLTWSDAPITTTMETKPITTGESGSSVGTATFVAEKYTVTVPLELKGAIDGPDGWWRLTHPAELLLF